jgi:hypothetical protein
MDCREVQSITTSKYLLDGIGLDILNEETLSALSSLMDEMKQIKRNIREGIEL